MRAHQPFINRIDIVHLRRRLEWRKRLALATAEGTRSPRLGEETRHAIFPVLLKGSDLKELVASVRAGNGKVVIVGLDGVVVEIIAHIKKS